MTPRVEIRTLADLRGLLEIPEFKEAPSARVVLVYGGERYRIVGIEGTTGTVRGRRGVSRMALLDCVLHLERIIPPQADMVQ